MHLNTTLLGNYFVTDPLMKALSTDKMFDAKTIGFSEMWRKIHEKEA